MGECGEGECGRVFFLFFPSLIRRMPFWKKKFMTWEAMSRLFTLSFTSLFFQFFKTFFEFSFQELGLPSSLCYRLLSQLSKPKHGIFDSELMLLPFMFTIESILSLAFSTLKNFNP